MSFIWPELLWLLLAVPALVAAYLLVLRRRKKFALRYASLDLVKEAMGARIGFPRNLSPLLFLVSLAIMIAAIERPEATLMLPSQHVTVILPMDVSGRLRSTVVEPNRLV